MSLGGGQAVRQQQAQVTFLNREVQRVDGGGAHGNQRVLMACCGLGQRSCSGFLQPVRCRAGAQLARLLP